MSQKVKGIYDALDHGNYKNALKLCDALLKKQPAHALCKSLYAVALERCGRRDEALQLCSETQQLPDADDTVLTTLYVVYRRCRQRPLVMQMYEAASARFPENEEYAVALFTSAFCCRSFAKAQQAAMKLYKKFNKRKYLLWVIVSMLMQVDGSESGSKVRDLAAMTLQKAPIRPDQADTPDTARGRHVLLLLHLETLHLQKKHDEALELLEACQAFFTWPPDVLRARLHFFMEAGRYREAAVEARKLYLTQVEDWGYAQEYLDAATQCPRGDDAEPLPKIRVDVGSEEAVEVSDHGTRLRTARALAEKLQLDTLEELDENRGADEVINAFLLFRHLQKKAESAGKICRVPYLAEMDLWRRIFGLNESPQESKTGEVGCIEDWRRAVLEEDLKDFVKLVLEYLDRQCRRNCCYADLKPFLALLQEHEVSPALARLVEREASPAASGGFSLATHARLRRAMSRLAHDAEEVGPGARRAQAAAEANRLLELWQDKGKTDVAGREDWLVLAIVWLIEADRAACLEQAASEAEASPVAWSSRGFLLDAISLAEMGIEELPEVYNFKVLLVLLYGALGLPTAMLKWYLKLELKNIQHESVSYLAFDSIRACGATEKHKEVCHKILDFNEDLDKDMSEAISLAFQNGAIQRVREYFDAFERARQSAVWGQAFVEDLFCELGQAQSQEALAEFMGRQGSWLAQASERRSSDWTWRTQDRTFLQGLHPLPLTSPCGVDSLAAASTSSRRHLQWLHSTPTNAVNSAAAIWVGATPKSSASRPARPPREPSAVERLLESNVDDTWLRLHILLLHAIHLLFAQEQKPSVDAFSKVMGSAREVIGPLDPLPSTAEDGTQAAADAAEKPELPSPWCLRPAAFKALFLRCAFTACSVAEVMLTCMSSGEGWEQAEQEVQKLLGLARRCMLAARGEHLDRGSRARRFEIAGYSIPMLAAFLRGPLTCLIALILWACTNLPKAGSGKKSKQGQEGLHATRTALRSLLNLLQTGLAEIQADLSDTAGLADSQAEQAASSQREEVPALASIAGVATHREKVAAVVAEAHSKHIETLRQAVTARLNLLKTKSGFKA